MGSSTTVLVILQIAFHVQHIWLLVGRSGPARVWRQGIWHKIWYCEFVCGIGM